MSKRRPPVNRRRQKAASTALAKRAPKVEVLTLSDIAELRRQRPAVRGGIARGEFGASGTLNVYGKIMQEDYNTLFDGKNALAIYDQMDRSDGQIGAAGEIIKQPIRAATWRVIPPESATAKEKEIAESAHNALFGEGIWPQGEGWDFTLRHLLMRVPFGFGLLEKIWFFDENEGILRWKRLAPRLPRTIDLFNVWPDGTLKEVVQYVAMPGTGHFEYKTIPAEYCVLSVREREGDNFFGKSVYRRLYKHWFYKDDAYRIDGIRLDRYGVGIPVAKIQEGHILEGDELTEIELVLMALRSHERAYIIEPPKVDFRIMMPEGGHGGATGLMESVQHHDSMIVRGILATFLSDQAEGLNSNRTRTLADVFLHALKGEAKAIANDLLSQCIRPFCDLNFDMTDARYPSIEITGIGDISPEVLSAALTPLIGAGAVTAEDELEDVIRKVFGLPPMPKGWKRGDKKPEAPIPAAGAKPGVPATGDPANNPVDDPEAVPVEADAITLAHALEKLATSIERQQPSAPPPQQPIVINMGGSKRVEYDKMSGRVSRIVHEDPR